MQESPYPGKVFYKCIKTSLKNIVRDDIVIEKLNDAATRANNIMVHTLQLLKLYLLHCYDTGVQLPLIDRQFVTSVMKVLCEEPTIGRPPSSETKRIKNMLKAFHSEHYEPHMYSGLNYKHMNTVLDYLSTDVITMYETNIKQHYVEYVERFVNVSWRRKELIAIIRKHRKTAWRQRAAIKAMCSQLRKVKNDLLSPYMDKTSHSLYHRWVDEQRHMLLPQRTLRKNSVYYDIKCSPQDYLPSMLYIMKKVEACGASVGNVCPLRSEIAPKHFMLDTISIIKLCFTRNQGKRSDYTSKERTVQDKNLIWGFFFKIYKKCFHVLEDKHAYTFDHQIETDGVSCSILLKRIVNAPKAKKESNEVYIDKLESYTALKNKRVVAIDPNMRDLLYCVDSDGREQVKFRHTQDQRRKETKAKKYRDYLQTRKTEVIDGKSVTEWETELSSYNRKTTNFESFKAYVAKKNEINKRLAPFYAGYIFRKLKLGSYMRRQITEARMLRRFEKLFGNSDGTVVCFGDFEQRHHRKFNEPIKGKGFRTLFRKAGYDVYLVDEFRTSCRCSACHGECKTFRYCNNPRPYRSGCILRHGLVKCKTCSGLWNRDTNAASNIWKVATCAIRGESRPSYLRRDRGSISNATSALHNHDSQEVCKGQT